MSLGSGVDLRSDHILLFLQHTSNVCRTNDQNRNKHSPAGFSFETRQILLGWALACFHHIHTATNVLFFRFCMYRPSSLIGLCDE